MTAKAFLLMTNVPPETWVATIDEQRKVIGRGMQVSIRVPAHFLYVSRRHCEIWADSNDCWICDIGSRTGTHLNGVWLQEHVSVRVCVGDRIWMGGVEFQVLDKISEIGEMVARPPMSLDGENSDDVPSVLDPITAEIPSKLLLRKLSAKELEVLQWLCRGFVSDEEVGAMLHRSPNTIRTQVASILRKLEIHSRADLIGWIRRTQRIVPSLPSH